MLEEQLGKNALLHCIFISNVWCQLTRGDYGCANVRTTATWSFVLRSILLWACWLLQLISPSLPLIFRLRLDLIGVVEVVPCSSKSWSHWSRVNIVQSTSGWIDRCRGTWLTQELFLQTGVDRSHQGPCWGRELFYKPSVIVLGFKFYKQDTMLESNFRKAFRLELVGWA